MAIERCSTTASPRELALYLLPNAFPIRFLESGDLLHLHHKWVHRLCYTAQEEIWRASLEEVRQVPGDPPAHRRRTWSPPCTLRKEAGITPLLSRGSALLRRAGVEQNPSRSSSASSSTVRPDASGARCSPPSSSECWPRRR